jgi:membrane protease YdiL (CAAX protease family)
MSTLDSIKPLYWGKTIVFTVIPAGILFITHYYLIPAYIERSGKPYFNGYWVGYLVTTGLVFAAAMIAYRLEGNPLTWQALKKRFRLRHMTRKDWLWTAAIILLVVITYFGLGFTGEWVNKVPFLAPRAVWPPEWGPGGTGKVVPGEFMGVVLKGQWWVVIVYVNGWLFNIFGEEFWFRGYLLPRHEKAYGKYGWTVNAISFWLYHFFQPWILIAILPSILLLVYVVSVRQNTSISIIQHGVVNCIVIFMLIAGVIR